MENVRQVHKIPNRSIVDVDAFFAFVHSAVFFHFLFTMYPEMENDTS